MKQLEEEEKNGITYDGEKKNSEGEIGAARSESEVSDRERSVPGDEGGGVERKLGEEGLESNSDSVGERGGERGGAGVGSHERREDSAVPPSTISIVISQPEEVPSQVEISVSKSTAADSEEKIGGVAAAKKGCLPSAGSSQEWSGGVERKLGEEGLQSNSDSGGERVGERGGAGVGSQERREDSAVPPSTISIVISQPEEVPSQAKISVSKSTAAESEEKNGGVAAAKKGCLPSAGSSQECR